MGPEGRIRRETWAQYNASPRSLFGRLLLIMTEQPERSRMISASLPIFVSRDTLAPGDLRDAFHASRRLDDFLQMREVLDLDEGRAADATVDGFELHAADVGPGA